MTRWTERQVLESAPDQSSVAAARKLARPGPWSGTGSTDTLVWGRCQGSGKTPYQVSVDLTGPAYRCSCPSRKFPCKHALALLLMWVQGDGVVAGAEDPAGFAQEWAQQRATSSAERAARSAERASATATPTAEQVEAQARRREARLALMDGGVEDFRTWMADLVRGGLAAARHRGYAAWDATAARLVDAQLPGLAAEVRAAGSDVHSRTDWAEHLLARLGRWWTASRAWSTREDLDPRTAADLRVVLGWVTSVEEVRQAGTALEGRWQVLGAHRTEDGRVQQQRTWLRHEEGGEVVQVLDFAVGQPLPVAQLTGSVLSARLLLYPGSSPRRALFDDPPAAAGRADALPSAGTVHEALDAHAALLGDNPWLTRTPVALRAVRPTVDGALAPAGASTDGPASSPGTAGETRLLAWAEGTPWLLLALTGGHPCDLFGELEGDRLRPLSALVDGELVAL